MNEYMRYQQEVIKDNDINMDNQHILQKEILYIYIIIKMKYGVCIGRFIRKRLIKDDCNNNDDDGNYYQVYH